MLNQQTQLKRIIMLLDFWLIQIKTYNYESFTDINKAGEDLSRRLLNLVYNYELQDLNKITKNYPGLDLGDETKAMVGVQVTSTNTRKKLMDTLTKVVKYKHDKVFTNGIKMLILNGDGFRLGKAKQQPADVLSSFDVKRDILVLTDLIDKIKEIYETDTQRFNSIMALLERELYPFFYPQTSSPADEVARPGGSILYKANKEDETELDISAAFLDGDLAIPEIRPAASRTELVTQLFETLDLHAILWISGPPSMGKTALAVLLSRRWQASPLWVDCRDVTPGQSVEHVLSLLLDYMTVTVGKNLGETLDALFNALAPDVLLIINDLPDLKAAKGADRAIARFLRGAQSKGIRVLVTSNFGPPETLIQQYDLDLVNMIVPPFEENDTSAVMAKYGATDEQVELFSGLVTQSAEGHPLLIQAGAKFLQTRNWEVDNETVMAVFTGKFGADIEKDIYRQVLDTTTDEAARDLLYRLSLVLGAFNQDTIGLVASAGNPIEHPAQLASALTGIWIQETSPGQLQLSPLIRKLGNNLDISTRKEIYYKLGQKVVNKKFISQVDAFQAVSYLIYAERYQQAAFVLYRMLVEFLGHPQLFFDWGFTLHWYTSLIPIQVSAFTRIQIRVLQVEFTIDVKQDASFLVKDLENILSSEEPGHLGRAMGNMALFHYYGLSDPLKAFGYLALAKREYFALNQSPDVFQQPEFDKELQNGIWYVFTQLQTRQHFLEWFRIFREIGIQVTLEDAFTNNLYRLAGLSIYRNVVLAGEITEQDHLNVLIELIHLGQANNVPLLAVYALKDAVIYLAVIRKDLPAAEKVVADHHELWQASPLFKFLVFAELAQQFFVARQTDKARYSLTEIDGIEVTTPYTEEVDYLILQMQISYSESVERSAAYSRRALDLVLEGDYLLGDRLKLYGEAATGQMLLNNQRQALDLFATGYSLLLDHFIDTPEQQALVIRYGSAINHLVQMLEKGEAPDYESGKFVIPEPGHFYLTNDALLEGGFYFDERRFMTATLICNGYENVGDFDNAKFWAYRSIELSMGMQDMQYGIMMLKMVFYPVSDRRYRQAYAVLQYLEVWLHESRKRIVENGNNPELSQIFSQIRGNDFPLYLMVLIPATFTISLDILYNRVQEEQFPQTIDDIFRNDSYVLQEPEAFAFARSLYENILLKRMPYPSIEILFNDYTGSHADSLRAIAYLLVATFAGAKEAAGLQLAILGPLDASVRLGSAAYRFGMVPYLIQFWRQVAEMKPKEFETVDHLRSAGWALVDKTSWERQIGKLFMVLSNHLGITPPQLAQDVIDRASS